MATTAEGKHSHSRVLLVIRTGQQYAEKRCLKCIQKAWNKETYRGCLPDLQEEQGQPVNPAMAYAHVLEGLPLPKEIFHERNSSVGRDQVPG